MGSIIVKNYPSPRLMETIGATNQTAAEAIGELVANCFDARKGNEKLLIKIDLRDDAIKVIDNGKGMSIDILEKAVCIAEDMSKYLERGDGAKGHFGMGFKTSCATLGNYYEIFTRPAGEKIELYTSFNIKDYSSRPSGKDAWDVEIETREIFDCSPLSDYSHGTAFVINKLKTKDSIILSAILDYLGEAFKAHLETGDRIIIVDNSGETEAIPKEYRFIKGTKINIDEKFGPNDKYHITGWMALDEQLNNNGFYGFNIYRNNQLVEKFDKTWFRAHLMTSRIIGEVNMDFLDATFYKQGVQQSEDWNYVKIHMTNYLKDLVKASREVSKKGNIRKPGKLKEIVSDMHIAYGVEEELSDDDFEIDESDNSIEKTESQSINNKIKNVVTEESLILDQHGEISITYYEQEETKNVVSPFDYIYDEVDDDRGELEVILYKNHRLWQKKVDDDIKRVLATSDAIYRVLVEKLGIDTSNALKIRNEWIAKKYEGD